MVSQIQRARQAFLPLNPPMSTHRERERCVKCTPSCWREFGNIYIPWLHVLDNACLDGHEGTHSCDLMHKAMYQLVADTAAAWEIQHSREHTNPVAHDARVILGFGKSPETPIIFGTAESQEVDTPFSPQELSRMFRSDVVPEDAFPIATSWRLMIASTGMPLPARAIMTHACSTLCPGVCPGGCARDKVACVFPHK
jgi:hypothetical protein